MVLKAHIWILVAVVVSLLCLTAPTIEGYQRSLAGVAATALAFARDLAVIDGFPDTPIDHLPSLPSGFTDQVSNFNKGAVGLHDTTATCNSIAGKPLLIHGNHEEADKDAANRASESCERSSTATTYLNGGRCAFTGSRQDERPVSHSSHELKSVEYIDDELSEKRSAPVLAGLKFEVNVVPCSYEAIKGLNAPINGRCGTMVGDACARSLSATETAFRMGPARMITYLRMLVDRAGASGRANLLITEDAT